MGRRGRREMGSEGGKGHQPSPSPHSTPPLHLNPRHETQRKWVTLSEIENTLENDVSCPNLKLLPTRPEIEAPEGIPQPLHMGPLTFAAQFKRCDPRNPRIGR